ncbi:MAG TPA: PAS domain-containing protein [Chryseosolibacter sp.]
MNRQHKILILEDSTEDVDLIEREIKRGGIDFISRVVKAKSDYEKALPEFNPDIILSDHSLPQFNSVEAMNIWKAFQESSNLSIPFILITGSVSEEFAVQTIKSGADDYVLKDHLKRLPSSIKKAIEKARLEKERLNYMSEIISQAELMREAEHLANFGCWKVDLVTGDHKWSDEAFRILGFAPGEIDPNYENFFHYIHPEDKENLKRVIGKAISSAPIQECEYRVICKEDKVKTLQSKILVKRDAKNRPYQLIGFTLDISKQKLQTRALELQNEKLMEIGWVQSHEVRAPLARILGLVHMINSYPDDTDDLKNALTYIMQNANELDDIIRKIVRKTEEIV